MSGRRVVMTPCTITGSNPAYDESAWQHRVVLKRSQLDERERGGGVAQPRGDGEEGQGSRPDSKDRVRPLQQLC
jgi:hypothetical protein